MQRYLTPVWAILLLACGGASVRPAVPGMPVSARRVDDSPAAAAPTITVPGTGRGSRGGAAFGDFVRSREPQLQFCYQEARAKSRSLAGSATVAVAFTQTGDVKEVMITRRAWSGGSGADVESCVVARVRAWKFPPSDEKPRTQSFSLIFTQ